MGTWGIAFFAAFALLESADLFANVVGSHSVMRFAHWLLTENPFYPVQIALGLYLGWLLGRRFQHRSMLWIWVLPLAILIHAVATAPTLIPEWTSILARPVTLQSRLSYYFARGCQVRAHCLDQLVITMPFYASLAYSVGALLARYTKRIQANRHAPTPSPAPRSAPVDSR